MPTREPVNSNEEGEHLLELRHLTLDDYDDIRELQDAIYQRVGGTLPFKQFKAQISTFPDGQICIDDKGKVVAVALSVIVDYEQFGDKHTYEDITGDAYITTHDPTGDVLYGVVVLVSPGYRGLRLGSRLYEARKELVRNLNLR